MSPDEFRAYKHRFVNAAAALIVGGASSEQAEAALPAYTNPNPLISYLFWERVRRVMRRVEARQPSAVLDFGCGAGVMLPFLAARAARVLALDVDLRPLRALSRTVPLPPNVEVLEERGDALRGIPDGSLDLALALDVLEHVPDLDHTVGELLRVVRPGGELIVTGPTENLFYKIGRRVAGPAYSGDYHVRDVMSIEAAMRRRARTQRLATLIPGVPLFRVLVAHREAV